jgi:hypothetical protein
MGLVGGMSGKAPKAKQELEEKEEKKEEIPFPLHEAASLGDLQRVIKLVEQGFNVNEQNEAGNSPYELAQNFGHQAVMDALWNSGAKLIEREPQTYLSSRNIHLAAQHPR